VNAGFGQDKLVSVSSESSSGSSEGGYKEEWCGLHGKTLCVGNKSSWKLAGWT
jgi:hypothetical protein